MEDFNKQTSVDENLIPALPISKRYGLILGLISVILTVVLTSLDLMDFSGQKSNMVSNLISWSVTIALIYKAIDEHKNKELGGYISVGRCAKIGALIGVISGIIGAIGMALYFTFIIPDFADTVLEQTRDNLETQGMSGAQLEKTLEYTKMFMSPIVLSSFGIIVSIIFDTIVGLLLGLFMKKERNTPFS